MAAIFWASSYESGLGQNYFSGSKPEDLIPQIPLFSLPSGHFHRVELGCLLLPAYCSKILSTRLSCSPETWISDVWAPLSRQRSRFLSVDNLVNLSNSQSSVHDASYEGKEELRQAGLVAHREEYSTSDTPAFFRPSTRRVWRACLAIRHALRSRKKSYNAQSHQSSVLQSSVSQNSVLQSSDLQSSVLQRSVSRSSVLQSSVLQSSVL